MERTVKKETYRKTWIHGFRNRGNCRCAEYPFGRLPYSLPEDEKLSLDRVLLVIGRCHHSNDIFL